MRLTIIPVDKTIVVDGQGYSGISTDWSWVPSNVHAVQWYGSSGEIEYNDGTPNETIKELGIYEVALTHKQNEDQRITAEREREDWEWQNNRDWPRLVRKFRTIRLTNSDWTQVTDNSLTDEQREAWRVYRQQLRDLPSSVDEQYYRDMVNNEDDEHWPSEPT